MEKSSDQLLIRKQCFIICSMTWINTDVLPGLKYNVKNEIRKRSMAVETLH